MQSENKLFDDFVKMVNGFAGTMAGMGREAEASAREKFKEWIGNGFLHHMVRNLVGTFLMVGKGSLNKQDLNRILEERNRSAAAATAPASGLYLVSVEY